VAMLMSPMLAVAIGVTPLTHAIAVSQGQAGGARNHKSCDCAEFRFPVPGGFNQVGRYTGQRSLHQAWGGPGTPGYLCILIFSCLSTESAD
jgi:hypothetical protein